MEMMEELQMWIDKPHMTRNQLESIASKLQSVSNCVRLSRIFLSQLFIKIPLMTRARLYMVDEQTKKDLKWWCRFLPQYNGISIMWMEQMLQPDKIMSTDACLTGVGGLKNMQYFHAQIPQEILNIPGIQLKC